MHGVPVSNKTGRLRFEDAARDLVNDYKVNHRRSLDELERRITKHLAPCFRGRRMSTITTADVRAYIVQRQQSTEILRAAHTVTHKDGMTRQVPEQRRIVAGVSNAEINRELTALKRMFTLAVQAGKLLHRPHVPLLQEDNGPHRVFRGGPVCERAEPPAPGAAADDYVYNGPITCDAVDTGDACAAGFES